MANKTINSLDFGDIYIFSTPYGTCSTAAGTAAKTVTVDNFSLESGAKITVKFTNANSVASPTLNVNSTGAKAIYWHGTALPAKQYWQAGAVLDFVYNGTQWDLIGVADISTLEGLVGDTPVATQISNAVGAIKYAGSSSAGGSATSAVKLDTSTAGSKTQPVYFTSGKPSACTYKLNADVPSDAKFTDTTYSAATTSAAGLMSAADKSKSDATNVAYGTCDTAAATAAKVVTITGNTNWKLVTGSMITVKFTETNSAASPTLNVNNTGAKPIYYNASEYTSSSSYGGYANRHITYQYDGTYWVFISWSYDTNSDTKVEQSAAITTAGEYPVILAYSTSTSKVTNAVKKTSTLKYNPSTKILTAPTFNGALTGNADTATKATQDASGNVITSTYATKTELNAVDALVGDTAVSTQISNAVGAITPASIGAAASSHGTHVSYGTSATAVGATAAAGSATTVSRSDHTHSLSKSAVITALGYTPPTSDTNTTYTFATGDSNGQIKVTPSGGTAQNVSVKGLGSAAYTASTAYAAASHGNHVPATETANNAKFLRNDNTWQTVTPANIGAAASSHNHAASNITSGTLGVARGGTGVTSNPSMLVNLDSTSAASVFAASPRPGVTGSLGIGNGGTNATTAAGARTNLEITYGTAAPSGTPSNGAVYFREDVHATLPITEGGTGATSVSAARANLGLNHVGASATCKGSEDSASIAAGGWYQVNMVASNLIKTDDNFAVASNGIQCPYDGTVYITGSLYITSNAGYRGCYIYKNGGELHSQYLYGSSGALSSGGMLVSVTAGDIITMKARSTVAGTVGPSNKATHLTVIYVD